jgi:triosephosphate isomerase
MKEIFVNLKRFDIPKKYGGLCPNDNPVIWIERVIEESIGLGIASLADIRLTYFLPEGLIPAAVSKAAAFSPDQTQSLEIGCQGIHWQDVKPGGNFGAFTSSLPASAAVNYRCKWTIIGHSEERKAKVQIMQTFDSSVLSDQQTRARALRAVDRLINAELKCALDAGLNVLLCVGETQEERGEGEFEEQQRNIQVALRTQLASSLENIRLPELHGNHLVIGYEPIWAIGPGKTPPGETYIAFVSSFIKETVSDYNGFTPTIVYGGGLKEENAAMVAGIETIGGGLVALTRFSEEIGFYVSDLKEIIEKYTQ